MVLREIKHFEAADPARGKIGRNPRWPQWNSVSSSLLQPDQATSITVQLRCGSPCFTLGGGCECRLNPDILVLPRPA